MVSPRFTEWSTNSPVLRTPACHYRTMANFWEADFAHEAHPHLPLVCDYGNDRPPQEEDAKIFDGYAWTRWTSENWQLPIIACVGYIIMLVTLKSTMRNRDPIRMTPVVIVWNFSLSAFSFVGMTYCVPHLLWGPMGILTHGVYSSVCPHSGSFGHGRVGFFVALFIYSKLAELVDTFFLLIRKSPVILLHWYHHVTVLLYCWHSYATEAPQALYFIAVRCASLVMPDLR